MYCYMLFSTVTSFDEGSFSDNEFKMKIGLVRHFKVDYTTPKRCNQEEYDHSVRMYNEAGVIFPETFPETNEYGVCYSSSMRRALETARYLYGNKPEEIIVSDLLVEIPIRAAFKTNFRIPVKTWNIINRFHWAFNSRRALETREQSKERAMRFLNSIFEAHSENTGILIVSHGLFMVTLQVELTRLGFKGREFFRAGHGELYEFCREG